MRRLATPIDEPLDVFRTCISQVRDAGLKARLTSVEGNVVAEANAYGAAASTAELHTLPPRGDIGGVVSADEMTDVYKLRMAKKGAKGRPIYDKLMAAPAHGRCPLCGQRVVTTLDHHLPKAYFPVLAVVPTNLVPACSDCNKAKDDFIPHAAGEQTFHPYFDDCENDVWLRAEIIEQSPAALRFFVDQPVGWDETKANRARHHFNVFKLATLYASHAAEELVGIRASLKLVFERGGAGGVRSQLEEQAQSWETVHENSWQAAAYKAMAASDWFCEGGFQA